MRWGKEQKVGDIRHRDGFLWLPKRIGDEWRWLEWAAWKEEFVEGFDLSPGASEFASLTECVYWRRTEWIDWQIEI